MMNLSLKATRFVIAALEHFRQHYNQKLLQEGLAEDEISDLVNDRHYLEAIQQDFEKYRDALMRQREGAKTNG
jgi:hypothetical protein